MVTIQLIGAALFPLLAGGAAEPTTPLIMDADATLTQPDAAPVAATEPRVGAWASRRASGFPACPRLSIDGMVDAVKLSPISHCLTGDCHPPPRPKAPDAARSSYVIL